MRLRFLLLILLLSPTLALAQFPPAQRTGAFTQAFDVRSPQSEIKSLTAKLGVKDTGEDYKIGDFDFLIYVPEEYTAEKPMGLAVLINYKNSEQLPTPVLSQFTDANCALVVAKNTKVPLWQTIGLSLDAVFNMQQKYSIDPKRVYVFSFNDAAPGEILGLNFPDVFTGVFETELHAYRIVKNAKGQTYKPKIAPIDAKSFALAKTHPFYIGTALTSESQPLYVKAMQQDGFRFIKLVQMTTEQFHYPNYSNDWLPNVFKFLDETTAKLTIAPSTQPAK